MSPKIPVYNIDEKMTTDEENDAKSTADRNRANHTGTQASSTISDFESSVRGTPLTGLSTATSTAVVATDSVLTGIGKLQANAAATADRVAIGMTTTADNITSTTFAAIGYDAIWVQARNARFKTGTVIFVLSYSNRICEVRAVNATTGAVLGTSAQTPTAGSTTVGYFTFNFTLPTANCMIELQARKTTTLGNTHQILAASLELDT